MIRVYKKGKKVRKIKVSKIIKKLNLIMKNNKLTNCDKKKVFLFAKLYFYLLNKKVNTLIQNANFIYLQPIKNNYFSY